MSRLLIRNGRVVDPSRGLDERLDLEIADGVVSRVGEGIADPSGDDEVIDAEGLVVAPGFVDIHVHLREPGFEYKETIATGLASAVAGGFTAVCPMPNTEPVIDSAALVRFVRRRAEEAGLARVYPIGAVSKGSDGEVLAEIGEMVREGAVAVSDDGRPVTNSRLMRRALEYCRSFDIPLAAHEEDLDLADGGAMHEGAAATRIGLPGIPAAAEEAMIARDVLLAELTGGRLHVCHTSTRRGLDMVRRAKTEGLAVTCEVTPHHFSLVDEDVARSSYDPNWKMNPPLRARDDVEAVLAAIADGTVDAIATDHAPHHADEKELDFTDAPFGIVGLETCLGLAVTHLLRPGVVDLAGLVRLLSTGPAETFGLPGGTLAEGSPADVTIFDPGAEWTVDPTRFRSRSRNTPYAGTELVGRPMATIVDGRVVWDGRAPSTG